MRNTVIGERCGLIHWSHISGQIGRSVAGILHVTQKTLNRRDNDLRILQNSGLSLMSSFDSFHFVLVVPSTIVQSERTFYKWRKRERKKQGRNNCRSKKWRENLDIY